MRRIFIIAGPTGSGKTQAGFHLASSIKGEIINADSRQFYKEITKGTAKPSKTLLDSIPHHFIDFISIKEQFTVFDFKKEAEKIILDIQQKENIPIIVGGSGLYIRILLNGIFLMPQEMKDKQKIVREQLKEKTTEQLYKELLNINPEIKIHSNDRIRIIRALEVWTLTGEPITSLWNKTEKSSIISESKIYYFILNPERENLYSRINERVDKMLDSGWIEEVKKLCHEGFTEDLRIKAPIGYPQIIDYLEGKCFIQDLPEIIKKKTRNYARKQLTWFRKEKGIWLNVDNGDYNKIVSDIISISY